MATWGASLMGYSTAVEEACKRKRKYIACITNIKNFPYYTVYCALPAVKLWWRSEILSIGNAMRFCLVVSYPGPFQILYCLLWPVPNFSHHLHFPLFSSPISFCFFCSLFNLFLFSDLPSDQRLWSKDVSREIGVSGEGDFVCGFWVSI
jgi:hypothetical protein